MSDKIVGVTDGDTITYPSGSSIVDSGLVADNSAAAGGGSGALSRGSAASAGGMWMGVSTLPPGHSSVPHHHADQTSIVCIVSGAMRFRVHGPDGAEEFTASAGQIAVIPGGLVHEEFNDLDVGCLCVVTRNSETPVVRNV
ncbi:MAG: cupin domain-containing protein [Actinomycetota bacterium]|nr:cupin domain-containing protein [Actinomycetota bacterium]